ncbi:MAG TPA: M20 family metallopeptidase [Longimicrobiales bacterium]|nr:M20 family metallopeptidase [Longimicrobiales bacterium]
MEQYADEMLDLLIRLVEAESPTPDAASQAGPQAILREAFARLGYDVRTLVGRDPRDGGRLLARPPRDGRPATYQLVVGHSDTVWDRGTLRTMPIEIRNRMVYGPGTFDMKGGLVQIVFALRALRELEFEPEVAPVAYINSDEEIGSPYSERHTTLLARRAERALIVEPASGPAGRIKTGRKGNGTYEVTVRGKAAHAGLDPEEGRSAIVAAAGLVQRLHELNDYARGMTVVVGQIEGGTRSNVVPAECRFSIDFRASTWADLEALTRAIEGLAPELPETSVEFVGGIERAPLERTPRNRRLWEVVRLAGASLDLDLDEVFVGGGSDGNITPVHTPTVDGLGPVGDGAHARHEHVMLDSLPERAALLALLLLAPPLGA